MRFLASKYKMLLQNWTGSKPDFDCAGVQLGEVDKCSDLGDRILDELFPCTQKTPLAFSKLEHPWRRRGILLSIKGPVYAAVVKSILLNSSETWPLENVRNFSTPEPHCLRGIDKVWWNKVLSDSGVRHSVLDCRFQPLCQAVNNYRLRCLEYVLYMSAKRPPHCTLFFEAVFGLKLVRGGQSKKWG